ncbi:MAG TPA: adenylate/guanylate cyclase domain-containing protein [Herpetosiphonaceae bacterium]|nr:adenylate/guanylate cyclase domain-containing protein [Herpetosiphonaceae bacterium]
MTVFTSSELAEIKRLLPTELSEMVAAPTNDWLRQATDWLHQRIAALSRFVPAPVVRHLLAGGRPGATAGAVWRGSLLFADLSGFTALSEHLASLGKEGSEEITRVINRLFSALVEQIEAHGGDLIKFGGDALTAFFDAELLGDNHAAWAVGAAQMMQERMGEIGAVPTRLGVFNLRLRIGVHSGQAYAAMLGDEQHQELMLTGADVNHVARAQEIARPGEVVCSAATLARVERVYSVPRGDGFEAILAMAAAAPPGAPVAFAYPPDTNDLSELRTLLSVYAGLRLFLPQRLTEEQLLSSDDNTAGEFRLVTVLFAHVAPFSTIIAQLGSDAGRITPLLNAYYARMQQLVTHYGGVVNKLDMAADGDKLLAIFGAPVTHENDAELSVRTGLAMQEAMNEINVILHQADPRLPLLDQQVGINQGHVFAGLVGSARRREYTVMGDPVNTAARLMSVCAMGDVLVSPSIQRACKDTFAFETLPALPLKGKSEPIEPARVDRAYNVRRDVARASLVGRQAELETICGLGAAALHGAGRVVRVSGEAGIGKSRLLEECLQWLTLASFNPAADVPTFTPITVECQFYEQTTPYSSASDALRQVLRLRTGLADNAAMEVVAERVGRLVPELARFTPLLADVLHLPLAPTPLTVALTPEQRHDRTTDLIKAVFYATARQTPLVLLWDDVHWIDASSRELLEALGNDIAQVPLLLLVGLRPEAVDAVALGDQAVPIALAELDDADRVALAGVILGGAELPPELLDRWSRGDETFFNPQGNPFFIEEMMRALIEQQVIVQTADGWQLQGNIDALPTTIEGVITARLDRLGAALRETVQIASVVGRRFQLEIIKGLTNGDLTAQMDSLAAADLVLPDQIAAEMAYLFKHTLTRDVAYEGILYARRRDLHRRVANRIQDVYGDSHDDLLPVLARHYARAEEWAAALKYYVAAGKIAQQGYFNAEAIAHYRSALELLPQLADVPAELCVELYERLGYVQLHAGEYPSALESFQTALGLLREGGLHLASAEARLLRHIATAHERRAEYDAAFEQLNAALGLQGEIDMVERARALLLGAGLHQRQSRYHETITWAEQGLQLAQRLKLDKEQSSAYLQLGGAYRLLGDNETAIEYLTKSAQIRRAINDIVGQADAYINIANSYTDLGNYQQALAFFEQAYELKVSVNDIYGQALALLNSGDLYRKIGDLAHAIGNFQQSVKLWQHLGSRLGSAVSFMNLGAALSQQGDYAAAESYLDQSRMIFDDIGVDTFLPELYRIYAELFYQTANDIRALDYCDFASGAAQKLAAKSEHGLTELLRSRVLLRLGQPQQAIQAAQAALEILKSCDNHQDTLHCLEHLAAITRQIEPLLSAEYAHQAEQIRRAHSLSKTEVEV